ncbi:hypothetical protein AgCh_008105 [Apium graveolens]
MKFSHEHPLILKENYHAGEGEICDDCTKPILCHSSVYICSTTDAQDRYCAQLSVHKNCVELPSMVWHLKRKKLSLKYHRLHSCLICLSPTRSYANYCTACIVGTCLDIMSIVKHLQENERGLWTVQHWSHEHPLRFVDRYSTFECDGCNHAGTDYSYMCEECPYWIHQSCANLAPLFGFINHKHPLTLALSLPKFYHSDQFCKICKLIIDPREWLYYCANCRFFAHIHCVKSATPVLRQQGGFDDTNLMHLPALDEQSLNTIMQTRIKEMISPKVDTAGLINHWARQHHQLALKNKSDRITLDEDLINQESERLIICDSCTKPISSSSDDANVFYNCNECNYSLHRYCAEFPKEVQHPVLGKLKGVEGSVFRNDIFQCYSCRVYSNGFKMFRSEGNLHVDVWCASLPEEIKHRAHHHPLKQCRNKPSYDGRKTIYHSCQGCSPTWMMNNYYDWPILFGCETCEFYLHVHCALKPLTVTHRWDPHPLHLVISLEDDVEDHPHEFQCEKCSQEIDTKEWFYHCNICDLSLHLDCINTYSYYSNVKFGAANIKMKAHEHDLTLVLNDYKKQKEMEKKQQSFFCSRCYRSLRGEPILECKPCNFIRHYPDRCCDK